MEGGEIVKDLLRKDIMQLRELMKNGEISSEELTEVCLEQIEEKGPEGNPYITVTKELALHKAREVDEKRRKGETLGVLAGIPMAVKDDISTKGVLTTAGAKMLEQYTPPFDATVIEHLYKEDSVLLGKLNVDEFGLPKDPMNPLDGSASAVAKGKAIFTIGSDTSGEIRKAACLSGVVGMKPTYGAVSRYGLIAYASSFDQIGPITKNVSDMAVVLQAIIKKDEKDSTSVSAPKIDYKEALIADVKGMKIALPKEYFDQEMDPKVKEAVLQAASDLQELGVVVEEVSIPSLPFALSAYTVLSSAEFSSNAARYDGIGYGYRTNEYENVEELYKKSRSEAFGAEVKKRIMFGNFVLSSGQYESYYKKAQQVRTLMKEECNKILATYDAILSPVIGIQNFDMDQEKFYTVAANLTGLPAISVPCGKDEKGLPMGFQLMGAAFAEDTLLKIAYTHEQQIQNREKIGGEQ
ncbi:MAG: Asp-tRNA(Asn)/Glu-tRNA(Gln) amidotransferase subunit GatA [Epulopiscium sp.]|nr:Asp-tRNA(Asn)/Glu-tRNA(Gln) amidotransferase subunit GatA [Candidatus Epulonipiscium sp.]